MEKIVLNNVYYLEKSGIFREFFLYFRKFLENLRFLWNFIIIQGNFWNFIFKFKFYLFVKLFL